MMKKYLLILICLGAFYLFVSPSKAFAGTYCWAGSGSGAGANWSVGSNWINIAGTPYGAGSPPGNTDDVVFDPSKTLCTGGTPTNNNSTVDASFSGGQVGSISIKSGYTGTVTQSVNLQVTQNAGYVQASTGS